MKGTLPEHWRVGWRQCPLANWMTQPFCQSMFFLSTVQFRVAASVRWYYLDEPWGAFHIRLAPGWMLFSHSDAVRFQAGARMGRVAPALTVYTAAPLSET